MADAPTRDVAASNRGFVTPIVYRLDGPVTITADGETAEIIDENGIVRAVFHLKQAGD
ncbi:hypothetical protein [Caballeronia sp. LZ019]|uniref:hypothetical protein n=1 Tax=Caballeronia sp. LZ019 TaxID=3038555 RepID=UPI002857FB8D|nr:hypothetical protein [Caballeronia sp. LZ019]MDR5811507.1 hypothetical protein [Caballeronia sp. LZ019]